jgi:hypothetical protein
MMPRVKSIFLRRSGVRNARANAVSTEFLLGGVSNPAAVVWTVGAADAL